VRNCLCAQDDLEPVLRAHAARQPTAELRFSTPFWPGLPTSSGS
jgi:hypothetical protein